MVRNNQTRSPIIAPEDFYSAPREKTLLNWFTYEVALNFEESLRSTFSSSPRQKIVRKKDIAPLAISLARHVKAEFLRVQSTPSVPITQGWGKKRLQLKSKSRSKMYPRSWSTPSCRTLKISPQWIIDEYPALVNTPVVEDLIEDLIYSLNDQLDDCATCDIQCLTRPNAPCTRFDTGPLPPFAGDAEDDPDLSFESFTHLLIDQLVNNFVPSKRSQKKIRNNTAGLNTQIMPLSLPSSEDGAIKFDFSKPVVARNSPSSSSLPPPPPVIFQFKITLRDLKPPVWRRVLMLSTSTFAELHAAIQEFFGWANYHLHDFTIRTQGPYRHDLRIIGLPPDGDIDSLGDSGLSGDYREDQVRLADFLSLETPRATYTYDFGDNWDHVILLEKVLPIDPTVECPTCVKEKGRCPPEDSGGPWGYMEDRDEGLFDNEEDQDPLEEKEDLDERSNQTSNSSKKPSKSHVRKTKFF